MKGAKANVFGWVFGFTSGAEIPLESSEHLEMPIRISNNYGITTLERVDE